jgi:hypothetical protein
MELFTIRYIYKDKTSKTLGAARASKWEAMKRKSTLRIPPDSDSRNLKVTRANYQVFILLNYMNPDAPPSPLQHGWNITEGICSPIRYTRPALPTCLSNIIGKGHSTISISDNVESDSDAESEESDFESDSDGYE